MVTDSWDLPGDNYTGLYGRNCNCFPHKQSRGQAEKTLMSQQHLLLVHLKTVVRTVDCGYSERKNSPFHTVTLFRIIKKFYVFYLLCIVCLLYNCIIQELSKNVCMNVLSNYYPGMYVRMYSMYFFVYTIYI